MSLLLDALKKAAQDKQKNTADAAPVAPPAAPTIPAVEQELTLELELDQAPAEEITAKPLQVNEPPAPAVVDELPTLAADVTPPPAEIRHEAAVVPKPAKPAPAPLHAEAIQPAPQPAASSKPAQASVAPGATFATQQAAAKQRDALEMMINKSRQADERKGNVLRYGLAIFSLLLILLAGIYFYSGSEPTQAATETPLPEAEPAAVAKITEAEVIPEPAAQPVAQHARTTTTRPRRSVAAVAAAASEKPAAEPVQFSKTTRADPIESLLGQAYEKFQAGDYDGANQLYTQVLQREADNRDGLLGAAAVAVKQQRFEFARQKYQQLLVLDPKDSLARAGLSLVDADARDESQLKFMLREQPEAAHLYFALGSVYASQIRWAEAQQAYFSAFSGDSSNADYAYNLAVSLDRLGQYKPASGYYQKALQLAGNRRGSFVAADLQTRIDQIARMPDSVK